MQALWIVDRRGARRVAGRFSDRRSQRYSARWAADPLRPLRLFWTFFRIGALNELQYRANLAIQLFQSLIALATGLAVLGARLQPDADLNGWSPRRAARGDGRPHPRWAGSSGRSIQPNMERLIDDVRQGTLDFVLTKPEDAQVLISVREFRIWQARRRRRRARRPGDRRRPSSRGRSGVPGLLAFVAALVLGGRDDLLLLADPDDGRVLDRPDGRDPRAVRGLYQSGRWPVTIYPGWLRISLTFLVPIAFAVTVPAEALTGAADARDARRSPRCSPSGCSSFTRWLWRTGLRRYSGASA